jgi:hypothetical protein
MFRPHKNTCSGCGQETIVVVKAMLCAKCNHEKKQAKKKAAGKKPSKSFGSYGYKEPTGEKSVFEAFLESLPDEQQTRCFVCGERISLVMPHNFAHVLPKKQYERFRLNPANLRLLCFKIIADESGQGCHYDWDFKPRSELKNDPKWDKMFELEEQLKEEYKRL